MLYFQEKPDRKHKSHFIFYEHRTESYIFFSRVMLIPHLKYLKYQYLEKWTARINNFSCVESDSSKITNTYGIFWLLQRFLLQSWTERICPS